MRTAYLIVSAALLAGCTTVPEPADTPRPTTAETTTTSPATTTTTTTEPVSETSVLLVIGDWGSGSDAQSQVAGAMEAYAGTTAIHAIVTTGDNFYSDDEVALMEPFTWVVESGIPFWFSWGNHDIESDERVEDVNAVFRNPPRWTVYEWGDIDVVILDSNQVGHSEQLDFLASHMAESDKPAIVVFHHPVRSCALHSDATSVLDAWVPLFDENVFLVLNGHDHNYQRFEDEGVTYVVTGGGGRSIYDLEECPEDHPSPLAAEATHHFVVLEAVGGRVTLTAYRTDLSIIDSVDITTARD